MTDTQIERAARMGATVGRPKDSLVIAVRYMRSAEDAENLVADIDRAIEAAVAAETERCAKVAEDGHSRNDIYSKARKDAAAAIRSKENNQ